MRNVLALATRLQELADEQSREIAAELKRSIEDCVTGPEKYSRESREALNNLIKQTHDYRGIGDRWYGHGKGAVVISSFKHFDRMVKLGFIDFNRGSAPVPNRGGCFPGLATGFSESENYFFLSQEAVDFYIKCKQEESKT